MNIRRWWLRVQFFLPTYRQEVSWLRALSRALSTRSPKPTRIVILCYHTTTQWWEGNLSSGTAGSEDAVVELARNFAERGWEVVVYNNCGTGRTIGNVTYRPVYSYNPFDRARCTIIWRRGQLLSRRPQSDRVYLWLHNVLNADEAAAIPWHLYDKVIALSRFHRATIPLPDDKVLVSRNGVVPRGQQCKERDTRKCIYASAPDRGLECLLHLWPQISSSVRGASLWIFYGWKTYDFFAGLDGDMSLKARILALMDQPGIFMKNQWISCAELQSHFRSAGAWLYPTQFEETSCITGMQAQLCGAIPVFTKVGALCETVRWGYPVAGSDIYDNAAVQNRFVDCAIRALTVPNESERTQMSAWAASTFSWADVAKQWETALLS